MNMETLGLVWPVDEERIGLKLLLCDAPFTRLGDLSALGYLFGLTQTKKNCNWVFVSVY